MLKSREAKNLSLKRSVPKLSYKGMDTVKCAKCGKMIVFNSFMTKQDYAYKGQKDKKMRYYCGWTCMNKGR